METNNSSIKQSFRGVIITLSKEDYELSREGHSKDDVLQAEREYINGKATDKVWFGSRGSANTCVAYLGENAEIFESVTKNK